MNVTIRSVIVLVGRKYKYLTLVSLIVIIGWLFSINPALVYGGNYKNYAGVIETTFAHHLPSTGSPTVPSTVSTTVSVAADTLLSVIQKYAKHLGDTIRSKAYTPSGPWANKTAHTKKTKHEIVAALTSILDYPVAVERLIDSGIPVFAVGDQKGPTTDWPKDGLLTFVTAAKQNSCAEIDSPLCRFIRHLPWNHFARKNVAYVLAIRSNSRFIWDFDDDNVSGGALVRTIHDMLTNLRRFRFGLRGISDSEGMPVLNPYPTLGPSDFMYPRGFPPEYIKYDSVHGGEMVRMNEAATANTVVFQAAANGNPDVDAHFRLNCNYNITFKTLPSSLVIDNTVMVPYNAQATLHARMAYWALYLPSSVHGRVADIWRAYISQAIFRLVGLHIAFVGPWVTHDRSPHNLLEDLKNEAPLYTMSAALIKFLKQWSTAKCKANNSESAADLLPDIYDKLHLNNFVGKEDIVGIRLWISTLNAMNYHFPSSVPCSALEMTESPDAKKFPILANYLQTIHIVQNHWEVIGPLRSLYVRVFPNTKFYVTRPLRTVELPKHSPFPNKTTWKVDKKIDGYHGTLAYETYLDSVDALVNSSASSSPPEYLLWHHDDLLVNLTTIAQFSSQNQLFAAMPGRLATEEEFIKAEATGQRDMSKATFKTRSIDVESLGDVEQASDPGYGENSASVVSTKSDRLRSGLELLEGGTVELFLPDWQETACLSTKYHVPTPSGGAMKKADFLLVPWKKQQILNDNLRQFKKYNIMLELAIPLALRCAHSADDIDTSLTKERLILGTDWSYLTRYNASTAERLTNRGSYAIVHPVKISMSQRHLSAALKFRDRSIHN